MVVGVRGTAVVVAVGFAVHIDVGIAVAELAVEWVAQLVVEELEASSVCVVEFGIAATSLVGHCPLPRLHRQS